MLKLTTAASGNLDVPGALQAERWQMPSRKLQSPSRQGAQVPCCKLQGRTEKRREVESRLRGDVVSKGVTAMLLWISLRGCKAEMFCLFLSIYVTVAFIV